MRVSFASSAGGRPADSSSEEGRGRGRVLIPTIAVIVALIILLVIFTGFYTDFLWFESVDNSSVFTTALALRVGLFLAFGVIMGLAIGASMVVAYRTRPMQRIRTPEQMSLERYRVGLEPLRRPLFSSSRQPFGALGGISAAAEWRSWSMWRNQEPFGQVDPQFGQDIGFYMFSYPWLRFLLGFGFAMVLLALFAAAIVHYLYGGIRLQLPGPRVSDAAQTQISILLGLFCLLKAAAYWLDRFGLALKNEDLVQGFTGLKYRDINALLFSEVDPHRHRADLCAAVLRQRIPAIVAGGGFGAGSAGRVRTGHRRHLPSDRPAVPGEAKRAHQRGNVDSLQHRRHPAAPTR